MLKDAFEANCLLGGGQFDCDFRRGIHEYLLDGVLNDVRLIWE